MIYGAVGDNSDSWWSKKLGKLKHSLDYHSSNLLSSAITIMQFILQISLALSYFDCLAASSESFSYSLSEKK